MLQDILQIEYEIAKLQIARDRLGKKYVDKNCPYKPGDKLIIKKDGIQKFVVVQRVGFNSHSHFAGMASLSVDVYTKNWAKKSKSENRLFIKEGWEIIEHHSKTK